MNKILLIMLLVTPVIISANTDWPGWRGLNHNGVAVDSNWNPDFKKEFTENWHRGIGKGYSAPSVVGDRLYVMRYKDNKDYILCLKISNGKKV